MNNQKVGFFDSGIGGLTVLKKFIELMPNEDTVYIGDEARMPYGDKTDDEIVNFSLEIANYLVSKHKIKMLVVACNTASAIALPTLKEKLDIPVIGVIESGAKYAANTAGRNIGVISTEATYRSNAYQKAINLFSDKKNVISKAEPQFVNFVETGEIDTSETLKFVDTELRNWSREESLNSLVLGCTHYPMLRKSIVAAVGDEVELIDSGELEAIDATNLINELKAEKLIKTTASREYLTTGNLERFTNFANKWLKADEKISVKQIKLEEL